MNGNFCADRNTDRVAFGGSVAIPGVGCLVPVTGVVGVVTVPGVGSVVTVTSVVGVVAVPGVLGVATPTVSSISLVTNLFKKLQFIIHVKKFQFSVTRKTMKYCIFSRFFFDQQPIL